MRQRDFISRMYAAGAPHGTGYSVIRKLLMTQKEFVDKYPPGCPYGASETIMQRLLMSLEINYSHSFKQDGYKAEYWGSRYTNYALDFYGVRGF
jgi:hypothetical protein